MGQRAEQQRQKGEISFCADERGKKALFFHSKGRKLLWAARWKAASDGGHSLLFAGEDMDGGKVCSYRILLFFLYDVQFVKIYYSLIAKKRGGTQAKIFLL